MDDQISRQAAIKIIENYCENGCNIAEDNWCPSCQREQFIKLLEALPSAEPERKKGKWLFTDAAPHRVYCSVCYKTYVPNKEWIAWAEDMIPKNFCPNCGADMRGDRQ